MAGGFFDDSNEKGTIGPVVPAADQTEGVTSEQSPGGLFERGGAVSAGLPASVSEADAKNWAQISARWAVGPSQVNSDGIDSYSDENNSKYWAEQSAGAATSAQGYADLAQQYANQANTSASNAEASATAAANSATAAAASQAAAAASATAAANSATAAATSASEADVDAQHAAASAATAQAAATGAFHSAQQAAASATAAANSATASANSASASATSATESATSATASATSATAAANSATAAAASATTATTEASDAEKFRDQAQAYADARGPEAGLWMSTSSDGNAVFTYLPNGSHDSFFVNSTYDLTGATFVLYVDHVLSTATRYTGSGIVPAGQWFVGASGSNQIEFVSPIADPVAGTRFDIFVTSGDDISGEMSVPWQAALAEYHTISGVVQNPTINLVAGTNMSGGGSFTLNQAGNETITFNAAGGGNPPPPDEHPTISLNLSEIAEDSAAQSITGTFNVASGYTFVGTGDDAGSAGNDTIHATGGTVTHSAVTANTFTWAFTAGQLENPGTHTVSANITATHSGSTYTHQATATFTVYRIWYTAVRTTAPATLSDMASRGRFNNPEVHTFTQNASGTAEAYVALPTRTNGYNFGTGANGIFTLEVTDHGAFGTGFTLYSFDLGDDSETYIVTISEA